MPTFTTSEILEVFTRAKNINGSIKNFLRKEVRKGDDLERFTRNFKAAVTSGDAVRAGGFIEKYSESHVKWLLGLAGYAHIEFVGAVSEQVVSKFAEEFNTTYTLDDSGLKISDRKNFERIAREALALINGELKNYEFESSAFMRQVVMNAIFDDRVLEEVLALRG